MLATLFSCFTRVTSQSPCMHATLATAAITMRNSRNVIVIVIRSLRVSVGETTEKGAKVQTA